MSRVNSYEQGLFLSVCAAGLGLHASQGLGFRVSGWMSGFRVYGSVSGGVSHGFP